MRILVYGWYGKMNLGDEGYKLSFPKLFPGHELTFTDRLEAGLIAAHDGVILGGGNILDAHHVGRLNRFAGDLRGRRVYAFSVGFTDLLVQRSQLTLFDHIYVRDRAALARLEGMGLPASYCPDAAFALVPDPARGRALWEGYFGGQDLYERRVVLVCNSHLVSGGGEVLQRDAMRFQVVAADLAALMDQTSASFLLVPFGCQAPWDDRVVNGWVAGQCKWFRKNATVYDRIGVQATLDLIAAADAVVSMRYHASVFASLAGVPFLDVYHHDKNRAFLETQGLASWGVSYWDFSRERAREILQGHLGGATGRAAGAERDQLRSGVDGIRFD